MPRYRYLNRQGLYLYIHWVYIYRYMPRYKCLNRQVVYLKIYAVMQGPKHTGLYMYRYMPRYRHLIQTCIYVLVFAINICSVSKVVLHAKIYNYIFNSRHKYIFVFNSWILESERSSFLGVLAQDMTEKSKALAKLSILN